MTPERNSRVEVRNPILALPSFQRIAALPPESRAAISELLAGMSEDARQRAEKSWRKNKGPMAAYWKAVSVYAKHIDRAIRHKRGLMSDSRVTLIAMLTELAMVRPRDPDGDYLLSRGWVPLGAEALTGVDGWGKVIDRRAVTIPKSGALAMQRELDKQLRAASPAPAASKEAPQRAHSESARDPEHSGEEKLHAEEIGGSGERD